MFTGIIQTTGKIVAYKGTKKGGRLCVSSTMPFMDIRLGESIAVDGCCLTVVAKNKMLEFDVSDETLRKTTIGKYHPETIVNLERALKVSDRLGGHFVLGHVDGVGRIREKVVTGRNLRMTVECPGHLIKYIIDKGSIAVDGISLTAVTGRDLRRNIFTVFIIPHTLKTTNLRNKRVGDWVNLEVDILDKYVESLMLLGKK